MTIETGIRKRQNSYSFSRLVGCMGVECVLPYYYLRTSTDDPLSNLTLSILRSSSTVGSLGLPCSLPGTSFTSFTHQVVLGQRFVCGFSCLDLASCSSIARWAVRSRWREVRCRGRGRSRAKVELPATSGKVVRVPQEGKVAGVTATGFARWVGKKEGEDEKLILN